MIKNYYNSAARRNSAPARCNSARQSSQQHPVCTSGRKRHRPAVVLSEEDEDDAEQDMRAEQPQVTPDSSAPSMSQQAICMTQARALLLRMKHAPMGQVPELLSQAIALLQ